MEAARLTRPARRGALPAMLSVLFEKASEKDVSAREIKRRMRVMMRQRQIAERELSIVITDDKSIHELNKQYRHKDKPTDVLSFSLQEGEFAEHARGALGDIVVSLPTAARQARENQRTLLDEVTFLLAHGLLHLLGYDHQTDKEERQMNRETAALLVPFSKAPKTASRKAPQKAAPLRSKAKKRAAPAAKKKAPVQSRKPRQK